MKLYICKKGEHKFKPTIWSLKKNRIRLEGEAMFTESCLYEQQYIDGNPYDGQNKLIGLSFHLSKKHENSALISWASKQGLIGVGDYWHIEGSKGIWWREPMITVVPNEKFYWKIEASIKKNTVDIFLRKEGKEWIRKRKEMTVGCWSWILPTWYGGQLPAGNHTFVNIEIF